MRVCQLYSAHQTIWHILPVHLMLWLGFQSIDLNSSTLSTPNELSTSLMELYRSTYSVWRLCSRHRKYQWAAAWYLPWQASWVCVWDWGHLFSCHVFVCRLDDVLSTIFDQFGQEDRWCRSSSVLRRRKPSDLDWTSSIVCHNDGKPVLLVGYVLIGLGFDCDPA